MTSSGPHAWGRDLAVVVLAAGAGTRLAPLSEACPKPLCPVGGRPLVDLALARVEGSGAAVAVNLHHGADRVRAHLEGPGVAGVGAVHLSEEQPEALGTAGAIGALRTWIDGRDVVVLNADAWVPGPLAPVVAAWDRSRVAVAVHGADHFGPRAGVVASLLPAAEAARLEPVPSGLYEVLWRRRHEQGRLAVVRHDGPFVDCGTPLDYLEANRAAARLAGGAIVAPSATVRPGAVRGAAVVGAGAVVAGEVEDSVLWAGATVAAGERLVRSVRTADGLTVGPLAVGSGRPG